MIVHSRCDASRQISTALLLVLALLCPGSSAHAALTDNGDGTVTDDRTTLDWQQGEPGAVPWTAALSYCEGLDFGGHTDWRLPNIKELESLGDDTQYNPAIDISKFPGALMNYYWTSTSAGATQAIRGYAWTVYFTNGNVSYSGKRNPYYVRCVRDGRVTRVTIDATTPAAAEKPPTNGRFVVTRTGPTASALTVFYAVGGSAIEGSDYTALPGSVVIPAGETEAEIEVIPIDDAIGEDDEEVNVTLSAAESYEVGIPSSATVTIASDDLPAVTISASLPEATEIPATAGQFLVTRTGPSVSALTVFYTASGSATAGSDYQALSGSVTIAADRFQALIWVSPIEDTAVEVDETVVATLNADAAYSVGAPSSAAVSINSDTGLPTGSILINNGAAYTISATVTLNLPATDTGGSGLDAMRFANAGGITSAWEPYQTTKAWTLGSGTGSKTVYVQFKDKAGNISDADPVKPGAQSYQDTIICDALRPTGSLLINGGAASTNSSTVLLSLSAVDTGGSGLVSMRLVNSGGTTSAWEPYQTTKSWILGSGTGDKTVYVQFADKAGNISDADPSKAGVQSYKATITYDAVRPTGFMLINDGAASTNSTTVTLNLSATDTGGSGLDAMRFVNSGGTTTGWEPYQTTKNWTLTSGAGTKTVWVQFRDKAGNISDADPVKAGAQSYQATIQHTGT